jgi:tRNA A-37 threonylcarbamoyl transferase component Bud32
MWVFKAVDAFHACGLRHNDLHERNIRIDKEAERAWIVDFEMAEKHECKHQPVAVGDVEPFFWKFGCPELFELAVVVKIWVTLGE